MLHQASSSLDIIMRCLIGCSDPKRVVGLSGPQVSVLFVREILCFLSSVFWRAKRIIGTGNGARRSNSGSAFSKTCWKQRQTLLLSFLGRSADVGIC